MKIEKNSSSFSSIKENVFEKEKEISFFFSFERREKGKEGGKKREWKRGRIKETENY